MKAENLDVLVRDLIETLGAPNRIGVPLYLLIAEAKAFAKQKMDDHERVLLHLETVQKDCEMHAREASIRKNAEAAQADRIKELDTQVRHTVEALNSAKEKNKVLIALSTHTHLMWRAEHISLEAQADYWKKVAADLIASNSMDERIRANGDEVDFINTLLRRRDDLPEDHPDRERLSKTLSLFNIKEK